MNCPNTIKAIIAGYRDLMTGDEADFERRHLVLRAALTGIGIDPDRLPDTCAARIEHLDTLVPL